MVLTVVLSLATLAAAKPRVPSGHDDYDYCRSCLHIVNELHTELLPKLQQHADQLSRVPEDQRYRKSLKLGEVEESLIEVIRAVGGEINPGPPGPLESRATEQLQKVKKELDRLMRKDDGQGRDSRRK